MYLAKKVLIKFAWTLVLMGCYFAGNHYQVAPGLAATAGVAGYFTAIFAVSDIASANKWIAILFIIAGGPAYFHYFLKASSATDQLAWIYGLVALVFLTGGVGGLCYRGQGKKEEAKLKS